MGRVVHWTPEDDARLLALHAQGLTSKEAATHFPTRSHEGVRLRGKRLGLTWPQPTEDRSVYQRLVLQLLARAPHSSIALHEALNISRSNVWRLTHALLTTHQIHIARYERNTSGPARPIFALGPPPDLNAPPPKRPPKLTTHQIYKRYVKKLKAERPEDYQRRVFRSNLRKKVPRPDQAAAWLKDPEQ